MITLIRRDEDTCALCTGTKPKSGYQTHSQRMGEAFLCKKHVDILMEREDANDTPLFDPPQPIRANGGVL